MDEIIAGRDLDKTFRVGRRTANVAALREVSLGIGAGEIVGLVGESGSGKSTLSRILIGVETPDAGAVVHDGRPVTSAEDWRRLRRDVQYVFQDPYGSLPPKMRVRGILMEPLRIHRIGDEREREQRAREMLGKVGLDEDAMGRYPNAFSGGQRQRISIARALMLQPRVIICDEVVSGLDVSIQAQVLNLLLDLQRELGLSLLFISHDLRVVRYLCERVCVMYLGEIVERGPTDQVLVQPQHAYTQALLAASP
jgi:ABC-type glutathione transport system ATPase component